MFVAKAASFSRDVCAHGFDVAPWMTTSSGCHAIILIRKCYVFFVAIAGRLEQALSELVTSNADQ